MKYLIVDAYFNGTGIRDKYAGGYINPESLNLSPIFLEKLSVWLKKYHNEFYSQYDNNDKIKILDNEGKKIALLLKIELGENYKIEYYSDANMKNEMI